MGRGEDSARSLRVNEVRKLQKLGEQLEKRPAEDILTDAVALNLLWLYGGRLDSEEEVRR